VYVGVGTGPKPPTGTLVGNPFEAAVVVISSVDEKHPIAKTLEHAFVLILVNPFSTRHIASAVDLVAICEIKYILALT
jgi:hypothetical protein